LDRVINERNILAEHRPALTRLMGDVQAEDLRLPPALTPAVSACTFTVRPPSRTFWVSASIHTNAYEPASSGRDRNSVTISSSSAAMTLTCDLDSFVTPSDSASFSTRRARDTRQ
jgi:hypothetical protein